MRVGAIAVVRAALRRSGGDMIEARSDNVFCNHPFASAVSTGKRVALQFHERAPYRTAVRFKQAAIFAQ